MAEAALNVSFVEDEDKDDFEEGRAPFLQVFRNIENSAEMDDILELCRIPDPDAGLELRPEFEERLRRSLDYVSSGGRMLSFEELIRRIEVE